MLEREPPPGMLRRGQAGPRCPQRVADTLRGRLEKLGPTRSSPVRFQVRARPEASGRTLCSLIITDRISRAERTRRHIYTNGASPKFHSGRGGKMFDSEVLNQGCPKRGPGAVCGPLNNLVWAPSESWPSWHLEEIHMENFCRRPIFSRCFVF